MSAHIFPESHFNTAEKFDVDGFDGEDMEIVAELAETLPKLLDNNGVLGFSANELASYHLIHYGADRLLTKALAETLNQEVLDEDWMQSLPGNTASKVKNLVNVVKTGLEAGGLKGGSLALGRIALSQIYQDDIDIPDELSGLTTAKTIPEDPSETRRPGKFLYPKQDVAMSYIGQMQTVDNKFVDYLRGESPIREFVKDKPAYDVFFDEIHVRSKDRREFFVIVSSAHHIGAIVPFE